MVRTAGVLVLVLLLGPVAAAQRPVSTNTASGDIGAAAAAAIDAVVLEEMQASHVPGVAVAVVDNGRVVFQRAYGVANLETDTPLTTSSVFELASVTKQFTAAAIMLLVEDGKVRLDDPISSYVERTPTTWQSITIRHLLTHTSGLDISALPRPNGSAPLRIRTPVVFDFLTEQPLRWPIGENAWYSDAGYFLLGMVIERAAGQSYREFLQQRMFDPLGMTNSSVLDKARVLKGRVATYSFRDGQHFNWRRDWDYELPSFFGVFSTLGDLAIWDDAIRQATVLKPSSLAEMWTPALLKSGQRGRVLDHFYGFGWELADVRGHRTVAHSGASGTYFLRFLDDPLTIIVLTNLDSESSRHHRMIAPAIAGVVRARYQPPHMVSAQADPDPEITRVVQTLISEIQSRRPSTVMSTAYRARWDAAPGERAWIGNQVGPATGLRYLAHDDMAGRSLWGGEPLARLVHYSADVKGRPTYLSVGLTQDRRVATLDFYWR
jgi:CubicO group peptidase (beta-lactamase class C family)